MTRRHLFPILLAALLCLFIALPLHAQTTQVDLRSLKTMTTDQVLEILRTDTNANHRQMASNEMLDRRGAFLPLLKIIAEDPDPKVRDLAIFPCLNNAPPNGQPIPAEDQDAVNAAVAVLLKRAGDPGGPGMSFQLLRRIATTDQLLPTLKQWLAEPPGPRARFDNPDNHGALAMEFLTSYPNPDQQMMDLILSQVDQPQLMERVLTNLSDRMPGSERLLIQLIESDPRPQVRGRAITALAVPRMRHAPLSAKARDVLRKTMLDPDPGVANLAAHELLDTRCGASAADFSQMAQWIRDAKRRTPAVTALKITDPKQSTPVLLPMMDDSDPAVHLSVATLLCRTDYDYHPGTVPPLEIFKLLDDPDKKIRLLAYDTTQYCAGRHYVVGPVEEWKALKIGTDETVNPAGAVPPYLIPPPPAVPAASHWHLPSLPPLVPMLICIIPFAIWPVLALVFLGWMASGFTTKSA